MRKSAGRTRKGLTHKKRGRFLQSVIYVLFVCAGGCITLAGVSFFSSGFQLSSVIGSVKDTSTDTSLNDLLLMSPKELEGVDIALMNLVCAEGLRGSEGLNINESLTTLDDWAERIREDSEIRMPAYHRNPAKYDNSENLFKLVTMIITLKNRIGVDYNMEIMQRDDFPDSRDVFIHGCLAGKKEGGCISMPVLCVAIGRRLGYPLKLALTRQHVFFRWDDGTDVFNMEACCPGCDTHPDDYYKQWPERIDDAEIERNHLLRSLTASEELGLFLETRGHCLFDAGRIPEAQIMYAHAYKLMPAQVRLAHMDRVIRVELKKQNQR